MLGAKRECCLANPVIYFNINMKEKNKTKQTQILKQVKLSFTFFISIHITFIVIYTRELTLPLI